MPRRGENIYKRKDNRWEGRYLKGYDALGKAQMGYVYAKTYRDVRTKLTYAKLNADRHPPKKKILFGDYCDEWLILQRNRVKESTYVKYANAIRIHVKPHLGQLLPYGITTVTLESFADQLISKDLSPKTVRDVLSIVRGILKHCRREIPCEFPEIEIIYPKESQRQLRVLSEEEQNRLIHYLLHSLDHTKFGVLLALFTGLRIGELCALQWKDISLQNQTLTVSSTMQRLQRPEDHCGQKTKITVGEAKSRASGRTIPLPQLALSLCLSMQPKQGDAYVLTGSCVRYMEPRTLQYRFKKYTEECGLTDVHFHTLRHTFATRCVEVGFEIKSLSEILGHSSAKITLDRYVHPSMDLKRENMNKLTFPSSGFSIQEPSISAVKKKDFSLI